MSRNEKPCFLAKVKIWVIRKEGEIVDVGFVREMSLIIVGIGANGDDLHFLVQPAVLLAESVCLFITNRSVQLRNHTQDFDTTLEVIKRYLRAAAS